MSDKASSLGSLVFNVVASIVLLTEGGFLCWIAKTTVEQGKVIATVQAQREEDQRRLARIELQGSPVVQRIEATLEGLKEGQKRIEEKLEKHINRVSQ